MKKNIIIVQIVAMTLCGCAASLIRTPVPAELVDVAHVKHMPDIRYWGDALPKNIAQEMKEAFIQTRTMRPHLFKNNQRQSANFIAISGGGGDGAYGAGLLIGWSDAGTRPEFDLVTGVSTGALSAPFVFLGSEYDDQLEEIYTQYGTKDLVETQILAGLLGGSALADNSKLRKLLAQYFDEEFMAAVAQEHAKGRRLLIGTTNLDMQRPVVWNMGKIAQRGDAQALDLFRKVIIASTSIPAAFPPVVINVAAEGRTLQELHVDGGTTGQVFFLPPQLLLKSVIPKNNRAALRNEKLNLYIIMNTALNARWQATEATTPEIASRSLYTLMKRQAISDLYKLYVESRSNRIGYNMASIPNEFTLEAKETFDKEYMRALFKVGYNQGVQGYQWAKRPPGLTAAATR